MATYRKFRDLDYGKPIIAPTHGDTVAPQNDLAAAAWLPISATATNAAAGFFTYDYQRHVFTDKVVIMPGKLVALTRESLTGDNSLTSLNQGTVGRLVPAGVRIAWKAAGGSDAVLEYTAEDVAERIENLCTGLPVTGAVSYTKTQVTANLKLRGLLKNAETLDAFISRPIGVAANVVYAWAGGDGTQPNKLRFMNYRRENKSTFWTGQDHTLRLPVAPKTTGTVAVPAYTELVDALDDLENGSTGFWFEGDDTVLATLLGTRYTGLTNQTWVGLALGFRAIEHNLYNPLVITNAAGADVSAKWLVKEVSSPQLIKKAGDYCVDRDLGILFLYSALADSLPVDIDGTAMTTSYDVAFSYSPVPTAVAGSAVAPAKVFAAVTGAVQPGDYLAYDKYSNFVPYVARPDETGVAVDGPAAGEASAGTCTVYVAPTSYHRPEDIVGKCYTLDRSPKSDLAAVKTFHDYDGVSLADRTPGSANDGHPAEIHQSLGGQFAAIVRVLL